MVIDGCTMVSSRDNFFYHEMLTHPVLFTHPQPKNVCIIGGGDCGTLRETLKHEQLERVIQIEIDERVTRLAEHYFPELCESNHDARAELKFTDGIQWMRDARANSLDIIIIDSTDPIGPAEGLFGVDFYRHCRNALKPDGLLVQQSESPLLHLELLKNMRKALHTAGLGQQQTLFFPQCIYPSGWWSATLASAKPLPGFRRHDVDTKKFATRYYNREIHQASLAQPEFFKHAVTKIS